MNPHVPDKVWQTANLLTFTLQLCLGKVLVLVNLYCFRKKVMHFTELEN